MDNTDGIWIVCFTGPDPLLREKAYRATQNPPDLMGLCTSWILQMYICSITVSNSTSLAWIETSILLRSWFLKRAYSERGAVKNAAPRTDDLKCIGDLAEFQRMRRSSNSFLIAVEVEGLLFFSSSTMLPRQWYEHFQPFPMLSLMIFGGFFSVFKNYL